MSSEEIISQTTAFVKQTLANAEGGHDWFHIQRVHNNSLLLIAKEADASLNTLVIQLGALLHDIADSKFHNGDETVGPAMAREFLKSIQVDDSVIEHVVKIIENISFKGGNTPQQFTSDELNIVQDADRLDAIGAIGIARTFNYGGFKNRAIYDPEIAPDLQMDKETYKKSTAPTINHFYEKLLLLKDRMNTTSGKVIAAQRHAFMEDYLAQFYDEWNGLK